MRTNLSIVAVLCVLLCVGAMAQTPSSAPTPIPAGSITAVISPQGTDAIKQTTGYAPKTASLIRIDVCNGDAASDHNVSTSRVAAAVILKEKVGVYGSDVVKAVLLTLQQRDFYTRAQKIIQAGGNTVVLLGALFKTISPTAAAVISAGPQIASAVLPAVSDPRDIAGLAEKILPDSAALALGRAGSGNDCRTGLAVAMSSTVTIDTVIVQ